MTTAFFITQSIIQTLMLKFGLKESTEFPRIHHQLLPPDLRIEQAMPQVRNIRLKKIENRYTCTQVLEHEKVSWIYMYDVGILMYIKVTCSESNMNVEQACCSEEL
jgi:hypothetical protein